MLVASRPILTSGYEGPVRGALILGRYLDSREIQRIGGITGLSLSAFPVGDPDMPPDVRTVLSGLFGDGSVLVRPLSNDLISGYSMLKDVHGEVPVELAFSDLAGGGDDGLGDLGVEPAGLAVYLRSRLLDTQSPLFLKFRRSVRKGQSNTRRSSLKQLFLFSKRGGANGIPQLFHDRAPFDLFALLPCLTRPLSCSTQSQTKRPSARLFACEERNARLSIQIVDH